ncbi:hypothetical protein E3N88_05178 [Mikania micrantha]|uniref:Pentatricopeptide repeat-containing protein n=1 Tax=Mikania micrantha TaxID=192012 RepID=A0A5N6PZB3_9ASTR|nr:hypothetical protein E3N88_05178 [Mikania micrantha]
MKLVGTTLRTQGVCQNVLKKFCSSFSTKSPSKTASSVITERKNKNPSHGLPCKSDANSSLYRRISPVGDPNISIIPVLDQWISEGRTVDKDSLDKIIKSLMKFRRFKHALEKVFRDFEWSRLKAGDFEGPRFSQKIVTPVENHSIPN